MADESEPPVFSMDFTLPVEKDLYEHNEPSHEPLEKENYHQQENEPPVLATRNCAIEVSLRLSCLDARIYLCSYFVGSAARTWGNASAESQGLSSTSEL